MKNLQFLNGILNAPIEMGAHIRTSDDTVRVFLHRFNGMVVGGAGDTVVGEWQE